MKAFDLEQCNAFFRLLQKPAKRIEVDDIIRVYFPRNRPRATTTAGNTIDSSPVVIESFDSLMDKVEIETRL